MWYTELDVLEKQYDNYKKHREVIQSGSSEVKKTKTIKPKMVKK
jgi:hypothetical protein